MSEQTAETRQTEGRPTWKGTPDDDDLRELARLMAFGLPDSEMIGDELVPAFEPLTLRQASKYMGFRMSRCQAQLSQRAFREEFARCLDALRTGELVRNLKAAIAIRDEEGDGSAAIKTVRLKAIQAIEGRDGPASVSVTVNQTTNNVAINPGYVIRLKADAAPALPAAQPVTIDASPIAEPEAVTEAAP